MTTVHPAERPVAPDKSLARAWVAVVLIPVFVVVALAVGEGTLAVLGHPSGGDVPLWADLIAAVTSTATFLVPCVAAIVLGNRAKKAGVHGAVAPMVIGALAAVAVIGLTFVTVIGDAIRG